jgi:hypothetical protein
MARTPRTVTTIENRIAPAPLLRRIIATEDTTIPTSDSTVRQVVMKSTDDSGTARAGTKNGKLSTKNSTETMASMIAPALALTLSTPAPMRASRMNIAIGGMNAC